MGHAEVDMSHMQYNISHMGTNKLNSQYLGKAMKSAIKQAGFTQDEAGIKAGIPRNSLNRKLNGGTFNFDELVRISQVTGRKLSDIIKNAEALADA